MAKFLKRALLIGIGVAVFAGLVLRVAMIRQHQRSTVRTADMLIPCDFNSDRRCNEKDAKLMRDALGSCVNSEGYNRAADINRNGCVTEADQQEFLSMLESGRYDR